MASIEEIFAEAYEDDKGSSFDLIETADEGQDNEPE